MVNWLLGFLTFAIWITAGVWYFWADIRAAIARRRARSK